jgi:hypothetical protein
MSKGVISSFISKKNRQCNDQKNKNKMTMVDNTPEVNSGATEGFVLLDLMCSVLRFYKRRTEMQWSREIGLKHK